MFTHFKITELQTEELQFQRESQNKNSHFFHFTYQSHLHDMAWITFQIECFPTHFLINYTTDSLREDVVIISSHIAYQLKSKLESDPLYRLRIIAGSFYIKLGNFLIENLESYHEVSQFTTAQIHILGAYENALPVYVFKGGISMFSIVSCGDKGQQLAECLKINEIATFLPSTTGIYQIFLYKKNSYKPFMLELIRQFSEIGYPCWLAYSWDKLG